MIKPIGNGDISPSYHHPVGASDSEGHNVENKTLLADSVSLPKEGANPPSKTAAAATVLALLAANKRK